jgi:hypothetical protein
VNWDNVNFLTTEDLMQEAAREVKARGETPTYEKIKEVFERNGATPPEFEVWTEFFLKHVWGQ